MQLFISESGTIFISELDDEGKMEISRKIQIMSLQAFTLLETEKLQQQYRSFVLHHKTQRDSLLSCSDSAARDKVMGAVKYLHWTLHKKNLPIYRIPEK